MIETRLLTLLLSLMVAMMVTAQEVNIDSLYRSYLTEDEKALIEKHEQLLQRLAKEKEQRQLKWTIGLALCAIVSLTTTVYIFKEVFKHHSPDTPLSRTIQSSVICICGGLVIFLLNLAWFYLSFEADNKIRYLILYAIIILLGIALWMYTKKQK